MTSRSPGGRPLGRPARLKADVGLRRRDRVLHPAVRFPTFDGVPVRGQMRLQRPNPFTLEWISIVVTQENQRRMYAGKIRAAVARFDDPLEGRLAKYLTASGEVGVLRHLRVRVEAISRELCTDVEREVAIRTLDAGWSGTLDELVLVACGVAQPVKRVSDSPE